MAPSQIHRLVVSPPCKVHSPIGTEMNNTYDHPNALIPGTDFQQIPKTLTKHSSS